MKTGFAGAAIGGGSLTNFTEFNRCRPEPSSCDFITYGNTAIVHAADDLSVIETLEALSHIFASASALAGGKPQHLGLFSIGMRSNPYGETWAANPRLERVPMALNDPRQTECFAAAYAIGVLAAAAEASIASIALAMVDGPLGAGSTPLGRLIAGVSRLAGQKAKVTRHNGMIRIETGIGGASADFSAFGGGKISVPSADERHVHVECWGDAA
ncbi:MAG: hypothetical protein HC779_03585 [Phyllobacteriaceae bacterium]|nr:hypothetical protein [Phyllobacteriaceae bacterium]